MNFDSETKITMHYNDGRTEDFSVFELSRWLCMVEAFEFIQEFADTKGINLEKCDFIKKPASLYEYINAKQPRIEEDILGRIEKSGLYTDYIFELI